MTCGQSHYLPLPAVTTPSQTGRLADELALAIHLGDMAAGEPLREVEIAESNGVSRTIVRAALQRLEAQGLAEIVLNKGARVRSISPNAARDLIGLHSELAATTARRAATRATPVILSRMDEFINLMEHVAEDGGPVRDFQHLRVGFARLLLEAAGPVWAERLRMAAPVVPHHDHALADIVGAANQRIVARLTQALLAALSHGDGDAASSSARAMFAHHADAVAQAASNPTAHGRHSDVAA